MIVTVVSLLTILMFSQDFKNYTNPDNRFLDYRESKRLKAVNEFIKHYESELNSSFEEYILRREEIESLLLKALKNSSCTDFAPFDSLLKLGFIDGEVIKSFIKCLSTADSPIKKEILNSLVDITGSFEEEWFRGHVEDIIYLISDSDPEIRHKSLILLKGICDPAGWPNITDIENHIDELLKLSNDESEYVRAALMELIAGSYWQDADSFIKYSILAIKDPSPIVRAASVRSLVYFSESSLSQHGVSRTFLDRLLSDENFDVQYSAVAVKWELFKDEKGSKRVLTEALKRHDGPQLVQTLSLIRKIGPPNDEAVLPIYDLILNKNIVEKDSVLFQQIMSTLYSLGPKAEEMFPQMKKLIESSAGDSRHYLASTIPTLVGREKELIEFVLSAKAEILDDDQKFGILDQFLERGFLESGSIISLIKSDNIDYKTIGFHGLVRHKKLIEDLKGELKTLLNHSSSWIQVLAANSLCDDCDEEVLKYFVKYWGKENPYTGLYLGRCITKEPFFSLVLKEGSSKLIRMLAKVILNSEASEHVPLLPKLSEAQSSYPLSMNRLSLARAIYHISGNRAEYLDSLEKFLFTKDKKILWEVLDLYLNLKDLRQELAPKFEILINRSRNRDLTLKLNILIYRLTGEWKELNERFKYSLEKTFPPDIHAIDSLKYIGSKALGFKGIVIENLDTWNEDPYFGRELTEACIEAVGYFGEKGSEALPQLQKLEKNVLFKAACRKSIVMIETSGNEH